MNFQLRVTKTHTLVLSAIAYQLHKLPPRRDYPFTMDNMNEKNEYDIVKFLTPKHGIIIGEDCCDRFMEILGELHDYVRVEETENAFANRPVSMKKSDSKDYASPPVGNRLVVWAYNGSSFDHILLFHHMTKTSRICEGSS